VELDSEIDRLYGVPLDEFVHGRDELAKRLRKDGDREAADDVKKLRKPTAGAWALNQAVRRRRKETDALLGAGERLREAHEALMSGGDPAELRKAMQEERVLAGVLADCAEAIASETGKSGPALRERVRSTLHAASVDEEAREELARGRFVREREAVGLGPFGGGAAPTPAPAKRASGRAAPKGRRSGKTAAAGKQTAAERKRAERDAAAERAAAAERERAARIGEAERELGEAQAALEQVRSSHSDAVDELESAREAMREAEAEERAARKAAREFEREVAKLERELERLRAKR